MKKLARICVDEVTDGGDIAKKLESVLNSEVAIADPQKCKQVFIPKKTSDSPLEDY